MNEIDVGKDFYHFLSNRDENQGNGKHTAVEFRKKYLEPLDDENAWKSKETFIILNFSNVETMISSFANEAFAYFTKYASPEQIKQRIKFKNISKIKMEIVDIELQNGYKSK